MCMLCFGESMWGCFGGVVVDVLVGCAGEAAKMWQAEKCTGSSRLPLGNCDTGQMCGRLLSIVVSAGKCPRDKQSV